MNLVFARDWVGATGAGINKVLPGSVYGLSGTQDPGFSYDWVQMMKYNPFLMYYGGNQVNAVLDFAPEGTIVGKVVWDDEGQTELGHRADRCCDSGDLDGSGETVEHGDTVQCES